MGNRHSTENGPGYPCQSLKLKSGEKTEAVPFPLSSSATNYEKLFSSSGIKEFIYRNLHSSYLVTSLLQNADDEFSTLSGISYFQGADVETRSEVMENAAKFQKIALAGINVKMSDVIQLCEQDMEFCHTVRSSPFLPSFQCRLALIRATEKLVANERSQSADREHPMEYGLAAMNTQDFPQVSLLHPMLSMATALLRLYPVYNDDAVVLSPLRDICNSFNNQPSLFLFPTWSPPPKRPEKTVLLDPITAHGTNSGAEKAINGVAHACWTCNAKKCSWGVSLCEPSLVTSVRIAWAPSPSAASSTASGAPKKLTINLMTMDQEVYAFNFDVDVEKRRNPTWTQIYRVEVPCAIASLELQMQHMSLSNQSGEIKLYNVEVFTEDTSALSIDTISILSDLTTHLLALHTVPSLHAYIFPTIIHMIRASGSLLIALKFISFISDNNLENKLREVEPVASAYAQLLDDMSAECDKVQLSIQKMAQNTERVFTDVIFDSSEKSPEVDLSEGGMMISCPSGGNTYGMLTCVMDSGVWEWEMTLARENHGDETTCLGVARRPMTNANYDTSEDMWLIRCYNGDTYHKGRVGRRQLSQIHPNDICRFTYDADSMTLSFTLNDAEQGIVFEQVDRGVSPCVAFYGSGKAVRLISIKCKHGSGTLTSSEHDDAPLPHTPCPDRAALKDPHFSYTQHLLLKLSEMCNLQMSALDKSLSTGQPCRYLSHPFCIQVTCSVLRQLFSLLNACSSSTTPKDIDTAVCILRILSAQFNCLIISEVNTRHIGLEEHENIHNPFLEESANTLKKMMNCPHDSLRTHAAQVFARGLPVFLPRIEDRIDLANSLLSDLQTKQYEANVPKYIVLKMIINKLSNCAEIVHILQLYKSKSDHREHIVSFISKLLDLFAGFYLNCFQTASSQSATVTTEFRGSVARLLGKFQEQLLYELAVNDSPSIAVNCYRELFVVYCENLFIDCLEVLNHAALLARSTIYPHSLVQRTLGESIVCNLLSPLLHALCLCLRKEKLIRQVLPYVVYLLESVTKSIKKYPQCIAAQNMLYSSLKSITPPPITLSGSSTGWRQVKAVFEDGESSFSVSDSGMLYTSLHSSNTCAVVNIGFSGSTKAAWEFCLEADSLDDECALFGAAHMPLTNRSYSASSDLYMRRAYNGCLYCRGRTVHGRTMDKIHQGDIIRVEYDGRAGTISYSVNGGDLEVAFTDVSGEVYPCCGSYRSNVKIRLLKVECCGSEASMDEIEDRPDNSIHWVIDEKYISQRDPSILAPNKKLFEGKDPEKFHVWVTARGDRGAATGIHEWSFEVLERSKAAMAFGVVIGGNPHPTDKLAGPCHVTRPVQIGELRTTKKAPEPVDMEPFLLQRYRSLSTGRLLDRNDSISFLPPPPPALSRSPTPGNIFDEAPPPAQLPPTPQDRASDASKCAFSYVDRNILAMSWCTDGSLWLNGEMKAVNFGVSFLPLVKCSSIAIRVDRIEGTVGYYVDGAFVGIAFGPANSGAAVVTHLPSPTQQESTVVYPAASLSSPNQAIALKPCGFHGSIVIPTHLFIHKTLASVVGRLSANLLQGSVVTEEENSIVSWLQSPLLIGGIEKKQALDDIWKESWHDSNRQVHALFDEGNQMIIGPQSDSHTKLYGVIVLSVKQIMGIQFRHARSRVFVRFSLKLGQEVIDSYNCDSVMISTTSPTIDYDNSLCTLHLYGLVSASYSSVVNEVEVYVEVFETYPSSNNGVCVSSASLPLVTFLNDCARTFQCDAKPQGKVSFFGEFTPQIDTSCSYYPSLSSSSTNIPVVATLDSQTLFLGKVASKPISNDPLSVQQVLLQWLEHIAPEQDALRRALSKSGTYSFPQCEFPMLACLLKHSGLTAEAKLAYENIVSGKGSPTPSADMVALWMKIKQLRTFLRTQRQTFKAQDAEIESNGHRNSLSPVEEETKDDMCAENSSSPPIDQSLPSLFADDKVVWHSQQHGTISRYNDEIYCVVHSLGIDIASLAAFITFSFRTNDSIHVDPDESFLLINDTKVSCGHISGPAYHAGAKGNINGIMSFRLPDEHAFSRESKVKFAFSNNFGASELSFVNEMDIDNTDESFLYTDIPPTSFKELCLQVEAKARFLLRLTSAANTFNNDGNKSKMLLLELLDKYSEQSAKITRWRGDDGEERWLRLVEVLRMSKRSKLSDSHDASPRISESNVGDVDAFSSAQAAMQVCGLFVFTKDVTVSPKLLHKVLQQREQRASDRTYALQALACVMQMPEIAHDVFLHNELIMFLRDAFTPAPRDDITSAQRAHYLCNLEGCHAESIVAVQGAFLDLYTLISHLLSDYIQAWRNDAATSSLFPNEARIALAEPMRLMMFNWPLHFSTRDHRFLLQCGILSNLYSLISFERYEILVNEWMNHAVALAEFIQNKKHRDHVSSDWKPWASGYVQEGLRSGNVKYRSVLLHLLRMPSRTEYIPFVDYVAKHNVSSVSLLYEQELFRLRRIEEEEQREQEKLVAAEVAAKKQEEEARYKRYVAAGIPLLHDTRKSNDVYLEDAHLTVGIKAFSGSSRVAAAFIDLNYDVHIGPEDSGNYFEITILEIGARDIGVGFAVQGIFPTSAEMPGWVPHSYGYHGDDGKRFGAGCTQSAWPTWENGDVIGCGLDFANRSIFYTRNGVLLGVGFANVSDNVLSPVVGFHSVMQKVKFNFGLTPFLYDSPDIYVHPAVVRLRNAYRRTHSEDTQTTNTEDQDSVDDTGAESKEDVQSATYEKIDASLSILQKNIDVTSRLIHEATAIRKYAHSLLRFLLASSCAMQAEHAETKDDDTFILMPQLTKDHSVFGTPFAVTQQDIAHLQEDIGSALLIDLAVGSAYLERLTAMHKGFGISSTQYEMPPQPLYLEEVEVEAMICEHLLTICSVLSATGGTMKQLLSTIEHTRTMLKLLKFGSPRIKYYVLQILRQSLMIMHPEDVEAAISSVHTYSVDADPNRHLTRQSPDTIVRYLLECIRPGIAIARNDPALSGVAFGHGRITLVDADMAVELIQCLFATPAWTEIVACVITNAFRETLVMLKNESNKSVDETTVTTACAAAISMIGFNLFRGGIRIRTLDGALGYLVSCNEIARTAEVVMSDTRDEPVSIHTLESVNYDAISLYEDALQVDLNVLSQPLVNQLVQLSHYLLVWSGSGDSHEFCLHSAMLWRLSALLSSVFVNLFENHPECIIEYIQDPQILLDILRVSSVPIPLKNFGVVNDVLNLWSFVQCRVVETSFSGLYEVPPPVTSKVNTLESGEDDISPAVHEISLKLSETTGKNVNVCAKYYQYFRDETVAEDYLLNHYGKTIEFPNAKNVSSTTLADDNVLRNIDYADCKQSVDDQLYFCELRSLSSNYTLRENDLICESDMEGCISSIDGVMGSCMSFGDVSADLVFSRCDDHLGVSLSLYVLREDAKHVVNLYNQPLSDFPRYSMQLDQSLGILRYRSLCSKLISDGYVNLSTPALISQERWIHLLKLLVRSTTPSFQQKQSQTTISQLCSALERSSKYSVESGDAVMKSFKSQLLRDALYSFEVLTYCHIEDSSPVEDVPVFSSDHPYQIPSTRTGVFHAPDHWQGVRLVFDKRSHFEIATAELSFYSSEGDYVRKTPCITIGGALREDEMFCSDVIPGTKYVQFAFEASTPSGLGMHQNLYNLPLPHQHIFSPYISSERRSFSVPSSRPIIKGLTYFEATVELSASASPNIAWLGVMQVTGFQVVQACVITNDANVLTIINNESDSSTVSLGEWCDGDLLSCYFRVCAEGIDVWFARNGDWDHLHHVSFCNENVDAGLIPVLYQNGGIYLTPNFGPSATFAHRNRNFEQQLNTAAIPLRCYPKGVDNYWGYEFSLQPFTSLAVRIARDFDLVYSSPVEDATLHRREQKDIYVWRPKRQSKYKSAGDIITTTAFPPVGTAMFSVEQCKAPKKFLKVCTNAKQDMTIWRPVPPTGFVTLGDIVSLGTGKPSLSVCTCVPIWAVEQCHLGRLLYKSKKSAVGSKFLQFSCWEVCNNLGTFFGSPSYTKSSHDLIVDGSEVQGVGVGYTLQESVLSMISGEWGSEMEVEKAPSFSWASSVTEYLLADNDGTYNPRVLFKVLLDYLRSKASPNSLKVLPLLIRMMRSGQESSNMNNLSHLVIQTAISKSKSDKLNAISDTLLQLVDLAIESVQQNESLVVAREFMESYHVFRDDGEWWNHHKLPLNFPSLDVPTREKVEALIMNKSTVTSQLHDVVHFFKSLTNEAPVPTDMVLSVWYKHLSNCYLFEARFPIADAVLTKTISVPGADRLIITFDHRCSFDPADVLLLEGAGSLHRIQGDSEIPTTLQISGSLLKITFSPTRSNSQNYWGISCLIHAVGMIYEQRTIELPIESLENGYDMTDEVYRRNVLNAISGIENETDISFVNNGSSITTATMTAAVSHGVMVKSGIIRIPTGFKYSVDIVPPTRLPESTTKLVLVLLSIMDEHGDKIGKIIILPIGEQRYTWTFDGQYGYYALYSLDHEKESEIVMPPLFQAIEDTSVQSSPRGEFSSPDSVADASEGETAPLSGWACPLCTLINEDSVRVCVACGTVNEMLDGGGDDNDDGESVYGDGAGAVWWCNMCTFLSPLSEPNCAMCGAPRPSDEAPATSYTTPAVETVSIPEPVPIPTRRDAEHLIIMNVRAQLSPYDRLVARFIHATHESRMLPIDMKQNLSQWTSDADSALLEYINAQPDTDALFSPTSAFYLPKSFGQYHSEALAQHSILDITARAMFFHELNEMLKSILPIINLRNSDVLSLGARIREMNKYVFLGLKQPMLEKVIKATISSGSGLPVHLNLDNFKSSASRERGEKEPATSQNCFVQAFHQLKNCDAMVYKYIFATDRVFQINFEGESGIDAGGVFREGVTRIIEDLFNENFTLLQLCPNAQHAVHVNLDKYLPNPRHAGPLGLHMFEFIGRLMGMSLRAKLSLPFEFPSLVWKKIVGDAANKEDLRAIDAITCSLLDSVMACSNDDSNGEDSFQTKFGDKLRFVFTASDGSERELFKGGKNKFVTFDSRQQFCDLVLKARLDEFDLQINSIARGLGDVVPIRILQLFSWQQLEILIAGIPTFDIALWKSRSEYQGLSSKTVELFWKVMESLSPKDQSGFVRFAWGRSRLPAPKEFTVKMKLSPGGAARLPVAHTCFFSVELPEYSTEEEMRHGILTAIHYGSSGILIG